MKVIPFEEKYRQDFIDFNTDWIVSNFGFLEEHGAERLFILSNSKLKPALHIYEKYGFREINYVLF